MMGSPEREAKQRVADRKKVVFDSVFMRFFDQATSEIVRESFKHQQVNSTNLKNGGLKPLETVDNANISTANLQAESPVL
jgi:hypothetical protein